MKEPDNTPLWLSTIFQEHYGGTVKLKVDVKPIMRAFWLELHHESPNLTEAEIKERAQIAQWDKETFRQKWNAYWEAVERVEAFDNIATQKMLMGLQETMRETLADALKALVASCAYKAITETNAGHFRHAPVFRTEARLAKVAKTEWDDFHAKVHRRLGIHQGLDKNLEKFWDDMISGYQKCGSPPITRLQQIDLAKSLERTPKTLRDRIKRNLSTDYEGFRKALAEEINRRECNS